jgi:hypothetical protein
MPTETQNHTHLNLRSILDSALAALPSLRPSEQSGLTWARLIKTYEDLPDVYKNFFEHIQRDGQDFPYTVLTPSYEGLLHPTTEKLIIVLGPEIYILESSGNAFKSYCYPIATINYVERGTKLLHSWLDICGVTDHGGLKTTTLKFNSVTDYLFSPILKCIRPTSTLANGTDPGYELEKFDHLAQVNYKFMRYARRSLLGGEKVIQSLLQPEIREVKLAFLGKSYYRTVSPTHITILTDRELIVIREDENWSDETRYGGIWDFIPLNKIDSLNYSENGDNLLELSIHIAGGALLHFIYHASSKPEIDTLINQYNNLALIQADK